MTIDEIRNQIVTEMSSNDVLWFSVLEETSPGHYGVDDIQFSIGSNDIWVDVPKKTYTFKNGHLSFSALIGGSKDGADMSFEKIVAGNGYFDFVDTKRIRVTEFDVKPPIDLFDED